MNTLVAITLLGLQQGTPATQLPKSSDQSVLVSTPLLTSNFMNGSCTRWLSDSHVSSIVQLIRALHWDHINIVFDQKHCDELRVLQSILGLTSTFHLSDLHSSIEEKQLLQEIHETFFPRINVLILSNYSRAFELLEIADQLDLESNRTTDFRHYSYWMVACYSPCQPMPSSHIYQLENVAILTQMADYPVLQQLVITSKGRNFSTGTKLDKITHKQDVFPSSSCGLNKRSLTVSTIPYDVFVMKRGKSFEGYLIDFLDTVASALNFSYNIVHPAGMRWGEIVDGRWDGLVGQLERREVDLGVAALTIHEDREKVMDFLYPPVTSVTDNIMYKLQTEQTLGWQIYLKTFGSLILLILLLTLAVSTLIGYILYRWNAANTGQERSNDTWKSRSWLIADTFFYMFGILLSRGMASNPRNQSTRLLLFTWGVFSVIMVTCYSANLVAVAAVQKTEVPFKSLAELVRQKEYKWGFVSGSVTEHIFRYSKTGDMNLVWMGVQKFNKTDPEVLSEDISVHISKVKTEKYAFIINRNIIERARHQDCDIRFVGEAISWEQYGIGVPTDYPLSGELERVLGAITDSGLPEIWWRRWNKNTTDHCIRGIKVNTVILQDIIAVVYLLCAGLGTSLAVLVIELVQYKLQEK